MQPRIIAVAFIVAGAMSSLSAQDAAKKQEPATTTVTVEGQKEPSLTAPDERRARERLDQMPGNVNVISGEKIQEGKAADMRDALEGTPGVYVSRRSGQEFRLSIRGSGLQRNFHLQGVGLYEDGIPVNLADGFGDFNMVNPAAMDYVEVLRGANAFPLGTASLGGAINFVTHSGRTALPFTSRLEGGSWGYINVLVGAGRVSGDLDTYAAASHYSEDGFRPHSAVDNNHLATNVGYRLSDTWETRMYVDLVRTVAELPGQLTLAQVQNDRRASDPTAEAQDWHRDLDVARVANKTTWKSGDQRFETGLYWMYDDLFHPLIWFPALNVGVLDQLTNDYGMNARYTNEQRIAGQRNTFTAGVAASSNRMRDLRFQNLGGAEGAKTADGLSDAVNLVGYVQDQFYITEPLSLVGGVQAVYTSRQYHDRFLTDIDGDQSFGARYHAINPMGGARYQVTPTSQVFANVSKSFEAPQYIELLNVRFDPGNNGSLFYNPLSAQRATTAELGTRGKEGIVSWELAYYYAWVHRELIATSPFPGVSFVSNAEHTAHQGVELGAEVSLAEGVFADRKDKQPGDQFFVRPTYTWNHFRFRNDPVYGNNQLPGVPEHVIFAELGYRHPSGAFATLNLEWVPDKYPADYANTLFADPYAAYGVRVGYRPSEGFSFYVEVRNLTDQRYVNSVNQVADAGGVDQALFHPAFARSYYAGLELRW